MSSWFKAPSELLSELGIVEAADIQIEAIAQYCNATIVYESLDGCAARILGVGDRAIITVDKNSPRARQRFSAAHELGHWMRDRGKIAFSCAEQKLIHEWGPDNPERRANQYGADLLLPRKLLESHARGLPGTFETVRRLSKTFETSLTATAIRLVELGSCPMIIVCHDRDGRKWFARSKLVPDALRLVASPGPGAIAAHIFGGTASAKGPETVDADDWISHPDASEYCLVEDSIPLHSGLVLTMLWWKNEAQILALDHDEDGDE